MASETSTADIAEKPLAYQEGLKGFLRAQTQPQNFLEHPATAFIPLAGPILRAIGAGQQQKRLTDAMIKASYFATAVKTGDFTPDHPAAHGIPLPIIQAGLLESAKIRATPSYQGRQLFEAATPSWNQPAKYGMFPAGGGEYATPEEAKAGFAQGEQAGREKNQAAFKTFAQNNPEIFGTLGNAETGNLAIKSRYQPATDEMLRREGLPVPGGGGQPSQPTYAPTTRQTPGPITQTPMEQPVTTGPGSTALQNATIRAGNNTPAFQKKLTEVAARLGANPQDLIKVMHFETGGTFSPSVVNKAGSGATGLIQFLPTTATSLGTTTAALARMSPEDQLDYVEKYLAPYKGRISNLQDLYMAVLYPDAIGKGQNYILFREGTKAYTQNAGLDVEKKGYVTAGDATLMVESASSRTAPTPDLGAQAQTPQAQTAQVQTQPSTDSIVAPLGQFNPQGPRPRQERNIGISGGSGVESLGFG